MTYDDDIHVRDFARLHGTLEPHVPISNQYELDVPQKQSVWWSSQQEHMVRWFSDQATRGSGAFTRAEPDTSARTTYNRLFARAGFVWIAETFDDDSAVVQASADAARAYPAARKRPVCSAVTCCGPGWVERVVDHHTVQLYTVEPNGPYNYEELAGLHHGWRKYSEDGEPIEEGK